MVLSNERIKSYLRRLLFSRMRILTTNGFYGMLLMHVVFSIDETCETAYTDGQRIAFSPKFMDDLSDKELDFVLMHEILHIVLRHCTRTGDKDNQLFNFACDIVVNSNIKHSLGDNDESIKIEKYGVGMHLTPDGEEGYNHTAEEVYDEVVKEALKSGEWKKDKNGNIVRNLDNAIEVDISQDDDDSEADSDTNSKSKGSKEKPNKKGGKKKSKNNKDSKSVEDSSWDDHGRWKEVPKGEESKRTEEDEEWEIRVQDAIASTEARENALGVKLMPAFAERKIREMRNAQTDWREVLNDFVQEEICDYSFSPPDRRYQDSDFFLPDYNEKDFDAKNLLFMIDTSGSVTEDGLTQALSEIKGAIEQFNGKINGKVGFFDTSVAEPKPFDDIESLKKIKPIGGGGTDFFCIFDYIKEHYEDEPPSSLIILTDGYADFPEENITMGIPTLWLISNDKVTPPWGRVARFTEYEQIDL